MEPPTLEYATPEPKPSRKRIGAIIGALIYVGLFLFVLAAAGQFLWEINRFGGVDLTLFCIAVFALCALTLWRAIAALRGVINL